MVNLLKNHSFYTTLLLLLICLAIIGCDPAISIRQVELPDKPHDSNIEIQIPLSRPLIGEGMYAPGPVQVTNLTQTSLKITSIQLISGQKSFPYEQVGPAKYPVVVSPGKSATLPVWFNLGSSVATVFKDTVEFRVLYEQGSEKNQASVYLIGGPLDNDPANQQQKER